MDLEQLVGPVAAGMALADASQAGADQGGAQAGVGGQGEQVALHLRAVAGGQEVLARPEQAFVVRPRRRNQRNPAGQGLEDADGRDARQRLGVEAARHVRGGEVAGEHLWRAGVGQPSAKARAVALQHRQRVGRLTYAVDVQRQARGLRRRHKQGL